MLYIIIFSITMVWLTFIAAALFSGDRINVTESTQTTTISKKVTEKKLVVQIQGESRQLDLDGYLVGVLLSEMPGSFHLEAKKAQVVAARTFALRMEKFGNRHGECVVCDDPGCCQGYLSEEEFIAKGGAIEVLANAKKAVEETKGMIILYDGELIEATYFSSSGGRTEAAIAVWGSEVPYLQSVESPEEINLAFYTNSTRFSLEEFKSGIGVELTGSPRNWFGAITYSEGGGVASMEIGGRCFSGNELRKALKLRSTDFQILPMDDCLIITTRGFGHRVGLSQYGANLMAENGRSFDQILKHYYSGVEIVEGE